MKNFLKLSLCILLSVSLASVAKAQDGDEAPEPTQTKMVGLHKMQINEIPVFIINNVEVEAFVAVPASEPKAEKAYLAAAPAIVIPPTLPVSAFALKTPWLHRCSRKC